MSKIITPFELFLGYTAEADNSAGYAKLAYENAVDLTDGMLKGKTFQEFPEAYNRLLNAFKANAQTATDEASKEAWRDIIEIAELAVNSLG